MEWKILVIVAVGFLAVAIDGFITRYYERINDGKK